MGAARGRNPGPSVNVERFIQELPRLFEDFPASEHPRDRRFRDVLEAVPGLACENNLALLNLAAHLLEAGESYVEVGSFRGTSLVAAGLGNPGDYVAVDDFSKDGGSADTLRANAERFGVERLTVLEGDAFDLLRDGALAGRTVGVYYYDGPHSYEAHLDGLVLIEQYLAARALIVVDDSDWDRVANATRDYLAGQPLATMVFDIAGEEKGFPGWWQGMHVIGWDAG